MPSAAKQLHVHDSTRVDDRPDATKRGYDRRWRKARIIFLARNPLCVNCYTTGAVVQAAVVDHKIPHRGDKILFWNVANWQALCERCHNIKTAKGQ